MNFSVIENLTYPIFMSLVLSDIPLMMVMTLTFCCSKKGLEDKILVPKPPRNCDGVQGVEPPVKLMEQMTTLRELVDQAIQKKEEQKQIAEEQAAKDRYWKIPYAMIMRDEHLDTIPVTESDEVIKPSVENLIRQVQVSPRYSRNKFEVPLCNNPTSLEAFKEHSETIIYYNDDSTLSDDDSPYGENIDYVDASPPDDEIVSLEVVRDC
ncbi:hypothetical protein Tco_0271028 [Tanacetum coccineum]